MFQINDNNRKVVFDTLHVPNIIALSLRLEKLEAMLKLFKSRSKITIKVVIKLMLLPERS